MSFESQIMKWAIPTVAVVLSMVFALDHVRRRRVLEKLGATAMLELMANSLSSQRRNFRAVLLVTALVLITATLARPTDTGETTWRQRGIDIVFVHDFSKSMLASDVYPNRLDRSLKEAEGLLESLAADRVATVVYAGGAVHFPLTHDHVAARLLYQGLRPSDLAPGSDLGQALRMATCILTTEAAEAGLCDLLAAGQGGDPLRGQLPALRAETPLVGQRARAIVLFSDGEDSEGFAQEEAEIAKSLGIEVFVVGVGTDKGELVPTLDDEGKSSGWQKDAEGAFVTTRLDGAALRSLAETAGGHYFSLGEGRWRGDQLLEGLKDLKRGDLDQRVLKSRKHIFERFLFPAFLLLIIEACLSERRRRVGLPLGGSGDDEE
jgi:Ca-activated chloride channel family protein